MTVGTSQGYSQLLYQTPAPHVARIVMNRPDKRNAQGLVMTYELDAAIKRACHDDDIRVIVLAGAGDHFNSGHDLSMTEVGMPPSERRLTLWGDYTAAGWEAGYSAERETYFDMVERWRNAPKPTVAEVQGVCMAGGVMLAFFCDLIVCADDARFRDTGVDMGVPGGEFFLHPYDLGPRKAKEWLFTADWLDAAQALSLGMVNHVVPRAELAGFTLALARRIADKDLFALKMIKQSVNACQDATGRRTGMRAAFHLHQLCHAHNILVHGFPMDTSRLSGNIKSRLETAIAAAKNEPA